MSSIATISILLCTVHVSLAGDCGLFSVGECNPLELPEDSVEVAEIPCDGIDYHECAKLCQRLCQTTTNCNFFSYDGAKQECFKIHEKSENEFLGTCDVVAGPESPTLEDCVDDIPDDECDRFALRSARTTERRCLNR